MLEALPAVVAAHPQVCYVIVGATDPDLLLRDGEKYREALVAQVKRLKMTNHVRFVDKFAHRVEMTRWLQAADVFVTPYPDLDQQVSGSLSYAMGAGRAIVSTPFAYAAELLADGRGVLVPAAHPGPLAAASTRSSRTTDLRAAMGRRGLRVQPADGLVRRRGAVPPAVLARRGGGLGRWGHAVPRLAGVQRLRRLPDRRRWPMMGPEVRDGDRGRRPERREGSRRGVRSRGSASMSCRSGRTCRRADCSCTRP